MEEQTSLVGDPNRHYFRHIVIRVVVACFAMIFVSGVVFGFAVLKPVLLKEDVYLNLCSATEIERYENGNKTVSACNNQELALNRLFQVSSSVINFLAMGIGFLQEKLGRRLSIVGSGAVFSISFILFGLLSDPGAAPNWLQIGLLPLLFTLCGLVGALIFVSGLKYQYDISKVSSKASSWVNSALTASWDLSSAVFYLFYFGYFVLHFPLKYMFITYGAVVLIPTVVFGISSEPPPFQERIQQPEPTASTINMPDHDQELLIQSQDIVAPTSMWSDLFSPKVLVCYFGVSVSVLHMNFYISTLLDQSLWVTSGDDHLAHVLNLIFSVMLPVFGFSSNFFLAMLLQKDPNYPEQKTAWKGWTLIAISYPIWTALSVIPVGWLQVVTYAVFIVWRLAIFISLYSYVAEIVPMERFGVVAFGCLTIAGLSTLLTLGINPLVHYLPYRYLIVNITLGVLGTLSTSYLALYTFRKR